MPYYRTWEASAARECKLKISRCPLARQNRENTKPSSDRDSDAVPFLWARPSLRTLPSTKHNCWLHSRHHCGSCGGSKLMTCAYIGASLSYGASSSSSLRFLLPEAWKYCEIEHFVLKTPDVFRSITALSPFIQISKRLCELWTIAAPCNSIPPGNSG